MSFHYSTADLPDLRNRIESVAATILPDTLNKVCKESPIDLMYMPCDKYSSHSTLVGKT